MFRGSVKGTGYPLHSPGHLNQRGRQFSRLLAAEVCAISGSNAGYTMFRGSVKGTSYPLHSSVSPSLLQPVRHRVPSHFNWTLVRTRLSNLVPTVCDVASSTHFMTSCRNYLFLFCFPFLFLTYCSEIRFLLSLFSSASSLHTLFSFTT